MSSMNISIVRFRFVCVLAEPYIKLRFSFFILQRAINVFPVPRDKLYLFLITIENFLERFIALITYFQ